MSAKKKAALSKRRLEEESTVSGPVYLVNERGVHECPPEEVEVFEAVSRKHKRR